MYPPDFASNQQSNFQHYITYMCNGICVSVGTCVCICPNALALVCQSFGTSMPPALMKGS